MRSNCMLGHHVGHMLPGDRTEVDLSGHEHANGSAPCERERGVDVNM